MFLAIFSSPSVERFDVALTFLSCDRLSATEAPFSSSLTFDKATCVPSCILDPKSLSRTIPLKVRGSTALPFWQISIKPSSASCRASVLVASINPLHRVLLHIARGASLGHIDFSHPRFLRTDRMHARRPYEVRVGVEKHGTRKGGVSRYFTHSAREGEMRGFHVDTPTQAKHVLHVPPRSP